MQPVSVAATTILSQELRLWCNSQPESPLIHNFQTFLEDKNLSIDRDIYMWQNNPWQYSNTIYDLFETAHFLCQLSHELKLDVSRFKCDSWDLLEKLLKIGGSDEECENNYSNALYTLPFLNVEDYVEAETLQRAERVLLKAGLDTVWFPNSKSGLVPLLFQKFTRLKVYSAADFLYPLSTTAELPSKVALFYFKKNDLKDLEDPRVKAVMTSQTFNLTHYEEIISLLDFKLYLKAEKKVFVLMIVKTEGLFYKNIMDFGSRITKGGAARNGVTILDYGPESVLISKLESFPSFLIEVWGPFLEAYCLASNALSTPRFVKAYIRMTGLPNDEAQNELLQLFETKIKQISGRSAAHGGASAGAAVL